MGQLMQFPQGAVFLKDGHPVTTSLKVAEVFGKPHKNVLRDINMLRCSDEFRGLNFEPSSYVNGQNKTQPMFEMTKDGFTFLVMGFTGPEAARYKEDYIRAFNMLLERLQAPQALPEPRETVTMDKVEAENLRLRAENAEMRLALLTGKPEPRRRNWQPEEVARLIALTQQGLKPRVIGEKLGRSTDSVETKQRELRGKRML